MIVLIGCGSVCATLAGAHSGIWQVAIVWGIGVCLAIYSTAEASGAHLNPAITLAFTLVRPQDHGMTWKKAGLYVAAQFAGAIACAVVNLVVFWGTFKAFERKHNIVRGEKMSILTASAFGEYFPNPGLNSEYGGASYDQDDVTPLHAMMVEAWGTFILAFVIFGVTNDKNNGSWQPPVLIGSTVSIPGRASGCAQTDPPPPRGSPIWPPPPADSSPSWPQQAFRAAWRGAPGRGAPWAGCRDRPVPLGGPVEASRGCSGGGLPRGCSARTSGGRPVRSPQPRRAVLLFLYAPITQAGWNPARDFGPRLVAACAGWGSVAIPGPEGGFWVYIVGPCIGAPLGAALAEKVLWRDVQKAKADGASEADTVEVDKP
ncbi:unnamed protein product [Prorocentrum cordatum]|uniref:Aquaporin n=1 Tax=Prorocentrum cordatum TaxID=2364126 RepID=A0ABN9QVQ1_9DINO|nr:unnamed protein product [Polarella glacialis]